MSIEASFSGQNQLAMMNEAMIEQMQQTHANAKDDVEHIDTSKELESTELKKGEKAVGSIQQSKSSQLNSHTKDKVSLRSFNWERNENGEFNVVTEEPEFFKTAINTGRTTRHTLRVMGVKVDVSNKANEYKQNYMEQFIQSRSPNFFLSRFAQLKCGFTSQILSLLGVTTQEIQKLQKEALKSAREENQKLMKENIYNIELCELIYGRTPKAKKSLELLQEMEKQLIEQMSLLGKTEFWTKLRLLEERKQQCLKIKEEFLKERSIIQYKLNHVNQELVK